MRAPQHFVPLLLLLLLMMFSSVAHGDIVRDGVSTTTSEAEEDEEVRRGNTRMSGDVNTHAQMEHTTYSTGTHTTGDTLAHASESDPHTHVLAPAARREVVVFATGYDGPIDNGDDWR